MELQVIVRVFLGVFVASVAGVAALAAQTPVALETALKEMRAYRWDNAVELAAQDGPLAADIIEWHRLRAGHGTADEVMAFLQRRPDWPGLSLLRKNSEDALIGQPAQVVLAFFAKDAPQTPTGAILFAQALAQTGDGDRANMVLQDIWRHDPMSDLEFRTMTTAFKDVIADLYIARLDEMLWQGEAEEVQRLLPFVTPDWQKLAAARLALRRDQAGVDALIAAVPPDLADDAGLAYERFAWRMRRGREDDAIQILLQRSQSVQSLGRPAYWARQRHYLAREKMSGADPELAFQLASNHFLDPGAASYSDLEWLAGYLALRFHNDADQAITHFQNLLGAVESPISLARAGYWLGRAYEVKGDTRAAQVAYEEAARHSTAFYGILAAEKLGQPLRYPVQNLPKDAWRQAQFTQDDVFLAGVLSLTLDETYLAQRFFVQLSESLNAQEISLLGDMLEQLNQPFIALRVAKHALRKGDLAFNAYFPLHPLSTYELPVNPEFVMAIARRESEFDAEAVSRAGASGLLQLMPGTASDLARSLDVPINQQRLTADWRYNAALGSTYIANLAERFDGNVVLVAAAYNAGPNRVDEWLQTLGDPRKGSVDVIDWIESIPYGETRNYVMRVTETLPAYRVRLGLAPSNLSFLQELAGSTLVTRPQ